MTSRREFVASSLAALGGVALWPQASAQATHPRKDVSSLPPNDPDIVLYARAVDLMRKLPAADPRNWERQARIHETYCPHNNWWFLPWHRAYLWYFEQTCRDVLQNSDFALPYWNWTRSPRLPGPFWQAPLLHPRDVGPNDQMPAEFVGSRAIENILGARTLVTIFSGSTTTDEQREPSATGQLEAAPHNNVHGTILGDMGTYLSPLDPIFWLHHANVDRLWASWARSTNNLVPNASLWGEHELKAFFDPIAKSQVTPQTKALRNEAAWGATYDRLEQFPVRSPTLTAFTFGNKVPSSGEFRRVIASAEVPNKGLPIAAASKVALSLDKPLGDLFAAMPLRPQLLPAALPQQPREAYVVLEKVRRPNLKSAALRVFLNCKDPGVNTPVDDPTYAGSISFFGHDGHGAAHSGTDYVMDISETLGRLKTLGAYDPKAPLDVSLVAIDSKNPTKPLPGNAIQVERIKLVGLYQDS